MEEVKNLNQDDVLDIMRDFPIQPLRNRVVITINVDEPDLDLVLSENSFSESQYVVAVGDFVTEIEPGQKILLDLEKMTEYINHEEDNVYGKRPVIKIDPIDVNGTRFAMVYDTVIKAKDLR